jgi:outer membrane lipoprotein carrier protein
MTSSLRKRSCRLAALAFGLLVGIASSAWADGPADATRPSDAGAPASEAAGEACRQRAVHAVQKRYEGVRDLRAKFVQTTRAASIGSPASEPTTSRGTMVVSKPSRMRWSYESPERSLVVSDGKTLWIYDPDFHEVQRLPAGGNFLSGAALQFLLGRGDMEREFAIRLVSCEAKAVELELTPRKPTSFEKLYLRVDPSTGDVSRTRIDDLLGNSTVVEFSDLEVNQNPPPELFHFDPPAGVRVIDVPEAGQ